MLKAYLWRLLATLLIGLAAIHIFPALVLAENPIYLPIISRSPTPTLPPILYRDNFSHNNSGWPEKRNGDCQAAYISGIYGGLAKEDSTCYYPAPDPAEHVQGQFQVEARRYNGSSRFSYGLYINGKNNNFYLFKLELRENNFCEWRLIRRENGADHAAQAGNCRSIYKGSGQFNTLKISHSHNDDLALYLNNQLLGTYSDSFPLTGQETGLYLSEDSENENVVGIFDNFIIYRP